MTINGIHYKGGFSLDEGSYGQALPSDKAPGKIYGCGHTALRATAGFEPGSSPANYSTGRRLRGMLLIAVASGRVFFREFPPSVVLNRWGVVELRYTFLDSLAPLRAGSPYSINRLRKYLHEQYSNWYREMV